MTEKKTFPGGCLSHVAIRTDKTRCGIVAYIGRKRVQDVKVNNRRPSCPKCSASRCIDRMLHKRKHQLKRRHGLSANAPLDSSWLKLTEAEEAVWLCKDVETIRSNHAYRRSMKTNEPPPSGTSE